MINHLNCLCKILFADAGRGVDTGFQISTYMLDFTTCGRSFRFWKTHRNKTPNYGINSPNSKVLNVPVGWKVERVNSATSISQFEVESPLFLVSREHQVVILYRPFLVGSSWVLFYMFLVI